jgi:hypothetical protein
VNLGKIGDFTFFVYKCHPSSNVQVFYPEVFDAHPKVLQLHGKEIVATSTLQTYESIWLFVLLLLIKSTGNVRYNVIELEFNVSSDLILFDNVCLNTYFSSFIICPHNQNPSNEPQLHPYFFIELSFVCQYEWIYQSIAIQLLSILVSILTENIN